MTIGDTFTPAVVSTMEWATLCLTTDLPPAMVRKELETLARDTLANLPIVAAAARREGAEDGMLNNILPLIEVECRRQMKMSKHIPEMARHEKRAHSVSKK